MSANPPEQPLKILAIEPYYGGSHRAFLDGLIGHSRHQFTKLTMPARKWKWRMRGAALAFAEQVLHMPGGTRFDLILTCDMLSVADLKALLPERHARIPIVCYFHENQLTYPLSPDDARDYQYGFTNITSGLAADSVWFNSAYHRDAFLSAASALIRQMPDCLPRGVTETLSAKATVMHPGIDWKGPSEARPASAGRPAKILWNHRWEYDKNPETFFRALYALSEAGREFRLVVVGEQFRTSPAIFEEARGRLAAHIELFGYLPDRAAYEACLRDADIVVSTANHEFFGLSVLEAVAAGCFPVLPRRLSYPELIPSDQAHAVFYDSDEELAPKLIDVSDSPPSAASLAALARHAAGWAWAGRGPVFDQALEEVSRKAD